jgi:L-lactate dehydrogenase complex protein LldE
MKIGLFIPCYVDNFYPNVGKACWQILKKLNCDVEYPMEQTCCGQPLGNAGYDKSILAISKHFINTFIKYDYIVAPSGSCVHFVKHNYDADPEILKQLSEKTYEFCDFLLNILHINHWDAIYPHRVAIHNSCHAHRGLALGNPSELRITDKTKPSVAEKIMSMVKDVEMVTLNRSDECCGFGGTFSIFDEAVSAQMGEDRLQDHINNKVHTITGLDVSCLMHLEGIIKRKNYDISVKHVAEILNPVL